MLSEKTLSDLSSNDSTTQELALNHCIIFDSLVREKRILDQIFNLLKHDNYHIREKAEGVLKFHIGFSTFHDEEFIRLLIEKLRNEEYSRDVWLRYTRLIALLTVKLEDFAQTFVHLFNSEGFTQGLVVFILRDLSKQFPELTIEIIEKILLIAENETEVQNNFVDTVNNIVDVKKAVCWVFWNNQELLTPKSIQILSLFSEDEDREIRRLACEILQPMIKSDEHRNKILKILERKINDLSWRVQKIAIESLISNSHLPPFQESEFTEKILGLFWHPDWKVRRNICEIIATHISLSHNQDVRIFLDLMVSAMDDPRWEVRETAIISLNQGLNLEKSEFYEILKKMFDLTNDLHEMVRKISCQIVSKKIKAFGKDSEWIFKKILWLLQDPSPIVRKEALENIWKFLNQNLWNKHFATIFESLLKLLVDVDIEVRTEAWNLINKFQNKLTTSQIQQLFLKMSIFLKHSDSEIRLRACNYLKEIEAVYGSKVEVLLDNADFIELKKLILVLLEDEEPMVLESAWEVVLNNKHFFYDIRENIIEFISKYSDQDSPIIIQICEVCTYFDWIKEDEFIRHFLLQKLSSSKNREIRKAILIAFLPLRDFMFLDSSLLISLIHEGQWDIQERINPILVSEFLKSEDKSVKKELKSVILNLLEDPIGKYRSRLQKSTKSIADIIQELSEFLTEDKIIVLFESSNDDRRLEQWIKLEENFDYIKKIDHPRVGEFEEEFKELLKDQIIHIDEKLNYQEILSEDLGLNTPLRIISLMRNQQERVRISLMNEIERNIDFSSSDNNWLKKAIINSLNDVSINLRNLSFNILQQKILPTTDFNEIIESVLSLTYSLHADARVRAGSILLSEIDILQPENENIFNRILSFLDDDNFLVRNLIWFLIEDKVDLSYPRYNKILHKMLEALSHPNPDVRNVTGRLIEKELNVFLPVIESYPQQSSVYHFLGVLYSKNKDFDKGIQYFAQNLERNPSDINSLLALALTYILQRKFNEAIQILQKAQEVDSLDFRIYNIWSECMYELDDKFESKKLEEIARLIQK